MAAPRKARRVFGRRKRRRGFTPRICVIPPATSSASSVWPDPMDIATFHASRRFAEVKSGRIAYFEKGQGPVALFLHGVPIHAYPWRRLIDRVQRRRRCIAIDLMGLGYIEIAPSQDVTFT